MIGLDRAGRNRTGAAPRHGFTHGAAGTCDAAERVGDGKVIAVHGPVLDLRFPAGALPALEEAVAVCADPGRPLPAEKARSTLCMVGDMADARRREAQTKADGLDHARTLRVVTAAALPQPVETEWRHRLARALGDGVDISFGIAPALLAGVELHFPTAVLHFSWQSALAAMQAEIGDLDHAR